MSANAIFQVVFTYVIGVLFIANAGEVQTPFLVWANWILAVFFIAAGSYNGWLEARR